MVGGQESPAVIILLHTIYLFGGTKKEKERESGRLAAAVAGAAVVAGVLGEGQYGELLFI
jgi:hypothetical protein